MIEAITSSRPVSLIHSQNGIRNGKQSTLTIQGLTRVRTGILSNSVGNSQRASASLRLRKASWWLTHMSPIQTPVDVRLREARRLTAYLDSTAYNNGQVPGWSTQYCRLSASDFIALVTTVVLAVTDEAFKYALVTTCTQELVRLTDVLWLRNSYKLNRLLRTIGQFFMNKKKQN